MHFTIWNFSYNEYTIIYSHTPSPWIETSLLIQSTSDHLLEEDYPWRWFEKLSAHFLDYFSRCMRLTNGANFFFRTMEVLNNYSGSIFHVTHLKKVNESFLFNHSGWTGSSLPRILKASRILSSFPISSQQTSRASNGSKLLSTLMTLHLSIRMDSSLT